MLRAPLGLSYMLKTEEGGQSLLWLSHAQPRAQTERVGAWRVERKEPPIQGCATLDIVAWH